MTGSCAFEFDLSRAIDGNLKLSPFAYSTPNFQILDGPRDFRVELGTIPSIFHFDAILKERGAYSRTWRTQAEAMNYLETVAREALGVRTGVSPG